MAMEVMAIAWVFSLLWSIFVVVAIIVALVSLSRIARGVERIANRIDPLIQLDDQQRENLRRELEDIESGRAR
jgi:membrane protein implicated in regulation of membrane protease activity